MISICFPLLYYVLKIVIDMVLCLMRMPLTVMVLLAIINMPTSSALPEQNPFPNITFKVFSNFIEQTFGPTASLSTALLLVFSILENPELLSLHA